MHEYSIFKPNAHLNWLDKLRSAKGFPVEPGRQMDYYLNANASEAETLGHSKETTLSERQDGDKSANGCAANCQAAEIKSFVKSEVDAKTGERAFSQSRSPKSKGSVSGVKKEADDWLDMTNNALAILFGMRDEKLSGKTHQRKQQKPRLFNARPMFSPSSASERNCNWKDKNNDVETAPTEKGEDEKEASVHLKGKGKRSSVVSDVDGNDFQTCVLSSKHDDRRETGDKTTSLSRTEVTLVDTSVPSIKSQKRFYRNGSPRKFRRCCIKAGSVCQWRHSASEPVVQGKSSACFNSNGLCPLPFVVNKKGSRRNNSCSAHKSSKCDPARNVQGRHKEVRATSQPLNLRKRTTLLHTDGAVKKDSLLGCGLGAGCKPLGTVCVLQRSNLGEFQYCADVDKICFESGNHTL